MTTVFPAFPSLPRDIWGIVSFLMQVRVWLSDVLAFIDVKVDNNTITKVIAWPFRLVFRIVSAILNGIWWLITAPFRFAWWMITAPVKFALWVLYMIIGIIVITGMYLVITLVAIFAFQWYAVPVVFAIWAVTTLVWAFVMSVKLTSVIFRAIKGLFPKNARSNATA